MPGPAPKSAAQRQRRNRTTTAATIEAPPATRVPLPEHRVSSLLCAACPEPEWHHTKTWWQKAERDERDVAPVHEFDPCPLDWRPATHRWWDTIWASPIADEWVDADVPNLLALAVLVDEFWTTGDKAVHAEMRQAMREFGLSPLSRRQLQWEVKRLESAAKPERPATQARPRTSGRSVLSVLAGKAG